MAINTETTGFGLQLTNVQLRPITAEEEAQWNRLMDDCHPLGNVQFAGGFIKYVAEDRGRAVAVPTHFLGGDCCRDSVGTG